MLAHVMARDDKYTCILFQRSFCVSVRYGICIVHRRVTVCIHEQVHRLMQVHNYDENTSFSLENECTGTIN